MEPGRELDKLVAEILGYEGDYPPPYSTDWQSASWAWEWLENNQIWKSAFVALCRSENNKPSVSLVVHWGADLLVEGESYPHAIALAVVETAKERNR